MLNLLNSQATKTVLIFLGNNWKELLLLCFLVAFLGKSHLDYLRLESAYETTQQSLENQISNLKTTHEEELRMRDQAMQEYKDALVQLQKEYEESAEKIESNREDTRKDIIKDIEVRDQFSENKTELAAKVINVFGFEYVP